MIRGGAPGSAARFVVHLGTDREIETKASARYELKAGDRFLIQSPGGGGYGDPSRRDPAAVARDVAEGYVTVEGARKGNQANGINNLSTTGTSS